MCQHDVLKNKIVWSPSLKIRLVTSKCTYWYHSFITLKFYNNVDKCSPSAFKGVTAVLLLSSIANVHFVLWFI